MTEALIIGFGILVAICLASIVRGARTEAPPPEGRVTSSPVIRPRNVRPPARPRSVEEEL